MEKQEQLKKLNADLHFIMHHGLNMEAAEIVYDALLHMQNTPGASIQEALDYISFKTESLEEQYWWHYVQEQEQSHAQFEDNLPF